MIQIEWTYALTGILAQTSPAPGGGQPQGGAGAMFFPAVMIAVLVFMFLSMRSQKKREANEREANEREAMFGKLAKNDRVLTIGGVIGTVLTVKDHEVVLKVDETTNTKMTFVKTAIQRVLTDGAGGEKA